MLCRIEAIKIIKDWTKNELPSDTISRPMTQTEHRELDYLLITLSQILDGWY